MIPSLHHLIEDYFRPKWWQFWKKQKYHVCQNYGSSVIYEVPDKCIISEKVHNAKQCARIFSDTISPHCDDGCLPLLASDPNFFQKLDEYLERGCYAEERLAKKDVVYNSKPPGLIGPAGPMGPAGPPGQCATSSPATTGP